MKSLLRSRTYILLSALAMLTLPLNFAAAQTETTSGEEAKAEETDIIETLILSDESTLQVLELYEELTDKVVIRRQDVPSAKINFNSRGPISHDEAILALESLLTLNGLLLTDMGGRFVKAVPASSVNTHTPTMLEASTLDLEPSQQIYSKFFRLQYLDSKTASDTVVAPLISSQSGLIAFPQANALLITDALINLQRIEKLLLDIDKPQKILEEMKFVKLDFVQASDLQKQLQELIKGPLQRYLEGNTSITADERSNQLIIVTHPGNLETLMEVVRSVDVDAAPITSSEVFPLRQAKASDVVSIIENIISGQEEGREEDAKVSRNEKGSNNANNNVNLPNANNNNPTPAAPTSTAAKGSEANSALQFSNFVGLSADERTNSIVAYGTESDLLSIAELIDKIDIPLPQVRIEAIITEVSLDEDQGSGLETFNLNYTDGATNFAGGLSNIASTTSLFDEDGVLDNISNWSSGKFALDAVLDLAEGDNKIKILSTPSIVVSHNEEGVINVSQSRPFETGSTSFNNSNNNTQTQVEYRDVGIKLTATPLIGADGSVQLQIEQTIDTVQTVDDTSSGDVNTKPIIGKREANSTVTVNDGDVIILGGLQENKKDVSNNYFPIIGRLPLFKQVLSGETVNYTRTELIIFIRPSILKTPSEAKAMSEIAIERLEESQAVKDYIQSGTTGDTYMEGSAFEKKKPRTKPHPLNRFRSK